MLDTHARKYVQPAIEYAAKRFLAWGWTPTGVTWLAFLLGASSGIWIAFDQLVLAVVILWISGYLDAVDGTMARLSGRTSAWGTLLDITFDRLVEISVIIGLAIAFPEEILILLLLSVSIIFSMTVFLTVGALSEKKGVKSFYYQAGLAERTEGFILFSVMILLPDWLFWSTLLFLIVESWTGLQRLMEARRLLLNS
jgi:phosphatidylglycerophosphate synthase